MKTPEHFVKPRQGPGSVVYLDPGQESRHEKVSHFEIGKRLASLLGREFIGEYDPASPCPEPVYFLPTESITDLESAHRLGIHDEHDLFGGVVPKPFIATKAITHPLLSQNAAAPEGWSACFPEQVQDSVLRGISAFSLEDAREAGEKLLRSGPVRIKPVNGRAGRGQSTVRDTSGLDSALKALDAPELARDGVVLEEFLDDVTTYSVGQIRIADSVATYYGTQHLTTDNDGGTVYGGSDLVVVRGGFEQLLDTPMPEALRLAVGHAKIYDTAAFECFPGFFASRRNYDIARGLDAHGEPRSGVLEQSWRMGGASSAEIVALEVFQSQPEAGLVRASSGEIYGEDGTAPEGALVLFRGMDAEVGFITKYVSIKTADV